MFDRQMQSQASRLDDADKNQPAWAVETCPVELCALTVSQTVDIKH